MSEKKKVRCAVCGKQLVVYNGDEREDSRKIKKGKHAGKYLCVSHSRFDLE